jgi:3-oxoadipate enol-lactonase
MTAQTRITTPIERSQFVHTSLGRLHVTEVGLGAEPLVLWPSIFTDRHIYDGLVARLGHRFRFVLIDGPGHGQSEGPVTAFPMTRAADEMAAVLDQLGLTRAIVGGTSWGGLVAAELALTRPDQVKALLLMNTPMEIDGRAPGLSARLIALGARWMPGAAMFRNGVAKSFFSARVLKANPGYAARFHAMLRAARPRQLAAAIRSVLLCGQPLRPRLVDLNAPTLVIAGRQDAMYPIASQSDAARTLPNGRFEAVEGKHISVVEASDAVAAILCDFVESAVPHGSNR